MAGKNKSGGGATTNLNGLQFEKDTDLAAILEKNNYKIGEICVSINNVEKGILVCKGDFYKKFLRTTQASVRNEFGFALKPDTAFFNIENQTLYIIEKKYQERAGSVDEKIQSCEFKLQFYNNVIRKYKKDEVKHVRFFYILNDFFKQPKYESVLCFIQNKGCDYYFNKIELSPIGL